MEIKADSSIVGNTILLNSPRQLKVNNVLLSVVFDDDVGEVQEEIDQSESDEDEERQVSISFILLIYNSFTVLQFFISKYLYRRSLPINYFTQVSILLWKISTHLPMNLLVKSTDKSFKLSCINILSLL